MEWTTKLEEVEEFIKESLENSHLDSLFKDQFSKSTQKMAYPKYAVVLQDIINQNNVAC